MEHSSNYRLFFCVLLSFSIAGVGFSEEKVHVIQRGETIYSIARNYGVSAQEVLALNKINDARTVQAGARIRIPATALAPASRQAYDEYRVERNDTLFSLARRFGASVPELLEMNGFAPNYVIKAGETIRIPAQQLAAGNAGTQNVSGQTSGTVERVNPIRIDPAIRWPIQAKEISNITGRLYGVQITGERRESVKSLTGGTVVSAMPYRSFGRMAIVQATGGYLYVYGGFETLSVKEGDMVVSGTELGKLGVDSRSAKPQLFFFVYRGNTPVDPTKAPRA